jgi:hypothetical protein
VPWLNNEVLPCSIEPDVRHNYDMKNALWFFAVTSLVGPAEAQQTQEKLPIERVSYVRVMPATVSKQMPHGATSYFYGSFELSANSPRFLLHLFNPNPKQDDSLSNGFPSPSRFMLHIFQVRKTTGTAQKLSLINRVQVNYSGIVDRPKRFGAHLLWLDPKKKRKPILKFDCFYPQGFSGLIGDEVLVVFRNGLMTKPVIQSFAYGSWRGSSSSGQTNTFHDIDENGLLQIRSYESIPTNEIPQPPPKIFRWNAEKFVPVQIENTANTQQGN